MSVFTIAEAGSCHDNVLENAIRLIRAAKACGGDAVKFQVCTNIDKLMAKRGEKPEARWAYEYLKVTKDWLPTLAAECVKVGIEFGCTAFIPEDIPLVAPFTDFYKIAAKESDDLGFIQAHFKLHDGKKTIISRRHTNQQESEKWLSRTMSVAAAHEAFFDTMYCVSKYPCPIEELKLENIRQSRLGGFSCHCPDVRVGAWAVAVGAKILEAHVRLDDTSANNPDYKHSFVIGSANDRFAEFVRNVRDCETAL